MTSPTRILKFVAFFALAICEGAVAQSNCVTRDLAIPSTVSGEITIGSCKQGSEYHDIYFLRGLTARRQLRFVLTKTTLPNLHFEMTRVQNLSIIDIINRSELSKSSMTIDVEIPVTQDTYSVFISGYSSYSTGGYTLSVSDLNSASNCTPNSTTICLNNDRFAVSATWRTSDGKSGSGDAVRLTADTGYFTFFGAANVEMVVKVLNGCGLNSRYWIFAGGLTNVNVTLTVRDTLTSAVRTYTNPLNTAFQPIQDTDAMPVCP